MGPREVELVNSQPMTRRTMLKFVAAMAGAVSVSSLLAACGGGGGGGGGENGGGEGGGGEHVVEMNDQLQFVPDQLTVNVGDTVVWRNIGSIAHTATCDPNEAKQPDSASLPEGAEPWNSGDIPGGEEWSHTFETAGDYTYFCIPHELQGMIAQLTVQQA